MCCRIGNIGEVGSKGSIKMSFIGQFGLETTGGVRFLSPPHIPISVSTFCSFRFLTFVYLFFRAEIGGFKKFFTSLYMVVLDMFASSRLRM